jgi:glycerophosphoryl diester phosphodiesterase
LVELFLGVILLLLVVTAFAFAEPPRHVDLYCHRTANQDVPENTLESLEQAALLGCDYVEVDVRRTLDGVLVLNHDGFLERLSDGIGEVELTYYADLQLRDFGAWMSPRFAGLHVATFAEALRVARRDHIQIILDIKTPGLVPQIVSTVREERMLDHVHWPPDSEEVRTWVPNANVGGDESWVQPNVAAEQVNRLHAEHKRVIANFSANGHELDLAAMRAAVCAGVDGINVDFPRIGADAVGRPVEQRLERLIESANSGVPTARAEAILALSRYQGFSLTLHFARWLLDTDDHVSRAAAIALVSARPRPELSAFDAALHATNPAERANAAWALGQLRAPASTVAPLLRDNDPQVLTEALTALSRMPGTVDSAPLLHLLQHGAITVRGPAALALAAHDPRHAAPAVDAQLRSEVKLARAHYDRWAAQNKPKLEQSEIDVIVGYYRCEMKMVQALGQLHDAAATRALEGEAFRPDLDFSQMNGVVASFQLWDRVAADPAPVLAALGGDPVAANRAEWMLIQAGPAVLPAVRAALATASPAARERLVEIEKSGSLGPTR